MKVYNHFPDYSQVAIVDGVVIYSKNQYAIYKDGSYNSLIRPSSSFLSNRFSTKGWDIKGHSLAGVLYSY